MALVGESWLDIAEKKIKNKIKKDETLSKSLSQEDSHSVCDFGWGCVHTHTVPIHGGVP